MFLSLFAISVTLAALQPEAGGARVLERSYWVHASLGLLTQKGYWGERFPATNPPTAKEIQNAARLLAGPYAANRLYLIYHSEIPPDEARTVFRSWKEASPPGIEIVPALVLKMYDKDRSPVFRAMTTPTRTRLCPRAGTALRRA